MLRNLLDELRQMIRKYYCWGRPIGSSQLWQQHFDTIERIGQIVERIELTPPPKTSDNQITFNDLPVEMIQEILLRLNDHRDLNSSAQASPVMRYMVDGPLIWRQLCRYHFTEQQLKLALKQNVQFRSARAGVANRSVNGARCVKYARTSSADGRTSYRNPTTHSVGESASRTQAASSMTTNSQAKLRTVQLAHRDSSQVGSEDAARAAGVELCPDHDELMVAATDKLTGSAGSSSSHVSRTIRLFDGSSNSSSPKLAGITARSSQDEALPSPAGQRRSLKVCERKQRDTAMNDVTAACAGKPTKSVDSSTLSSSRGNESSKTSTQTKGQSRPPTTVAGGSKMNLQSSRPQAQTTPSSSSTAGGNNIDWKKVFHQLRKQFDLKEEYADCLLLCRHCRCLFWKSIGHPCIKDPEIDVHETAHHCSCAGQIVQPSASQTVNRARRGDGVASRRINNTSRNPMNINNNQPGVSVAALSRNFGGRADDHRGNENVAPSSRNHRPLNNQPRPVVDYRRDGRQPVLPELALQRLADLNPRLANRIAINQAVANNRGGHNQNPSRMRQETMPKHVAISPQAFLKFFSL